MSDEGRAIVGFLSEFVGALGDLLLGAGTWVESTARRYIRFLWKAGKVFAIAASALTGIVVVGALTGLEWLLPAATLLVGASAALFLLLASPIGVLAVKLGTEVDAVNRFVKLVSGILLWALLLSLYFSLVPVSSRPSAVFVVVLITFIIALLWAAFGVGPNPHRVYASVVSIFLLVTASFFFPQTFAAAIGLRGRIDETLAKCLTSPSACFGERLSGKQDGGTGRLSAGQIMRFDHTVPEVCPGSVVRIPANGRMIFRYGSRTGCNVTWNEPLLSGERVKRTYVFSGNRTEELMIRRGDPEAPFSHEQPVAIVLEAFETDVTAGFYDRRPGVR